MSLDGGSQRSAEDVRGRRPRMTVRGRSVEDAAQDVRGRRPKDLFFRQNIVIAPNDP